MATQICHYSDYAGSQDDAHRWPHVLPGTAERLLLRISCGAPTPSLELQSTLAMLSWRIDCNSGSCCSGIEYCLGSQICLQMHTRATGTITAATCMVQAWDVNTGRQLLQDITTKMNADQSILAGNIGPSTLRQSILGYNQGNNGGRTLLQDVTTKMNADQSILAGNIGPDTIHKSIFGYQQGRSLLQDITTKVRTTTPFLT